VIGKCRDKKAIAALHAKVDGWYSEGYRVIAIATKQVTASERYTFTDAHHLKLEGFILFSDPPKHGARAALDHFENLGVKLKVVTGDNEFVTRKICQEIDLKCDKILTGPEVSRMTESELIDVVWQTDVFARMTPDKKLRVIRALKHGNHTVAYIGDGINDAPALHEADAGISVDTAVDVAKDTASIVLMRKSLNVIVEGVAEGRRTFVNTLKYILMGTSSNFGNMFSMAGASFILPFLPMTPSQILLTNAMYDVSQLSIPTDNVDPEELHQPKKWDIGIIRRYMIFFGPISSLYDFMTFGVMYFLFHARGSLFQTGWFVESLATQIMVIFIIRTNRMPFYKSRPGLISWPAWERLCRHVSAVFPFPVFLNFHHALLYFLISFSWSHPSRLLKG
jgi:Mg2+-importing ATPase